MRYAQTYKWTGDKKYLEVACGLVEYFLERLEYTAMYSDESVNGFEPREDREGLYVPVWDFNAPIDDTGEAPKDSSAGVIAANGMLILSQALTSQQRHR